jgi:hypothetical protein
MKCEVLFLGAKDIRAIIATVELNRLQMGFSFCSRNQNSSSQARAGHIQIHIRD